MSWQRRYTHVHALDLAKMATSCSACADSVEEFQQLEGAVSAVRKSLGFPAQNSKIPEPDKRKRKRVHCKICHHVFSYVFKTTNSAYYMAEQILSQQQALCGSSVVATFSPASLQATLYIVPLKSPWISLPSTPWLRVRQRAISSVVWTCCIRESTL